MKIKKFEDFPTGNEAGRFLVNPFWLEHLLNLFYQGYVGEVADEIWDTTSNQIMSIKNLGYGIIGQEFDKKHLPSEFTETVSKTNDKGVNKE